MNRYDFSKDWREQIVSRPIRRDEELQVAEGHVGIYAAAYIPEFLDVFSVIMSFPKDEVITRELIKNRAVTRLEKCIEKRNEWKQHLKLEKLSNTDTAAKLLGSDLDAESYTSILDAVTTGEASFFHVTAEIPELESSVSVYAMTYGTPEQQETAAKRGALAQFEQLVQAQYMERYVETMNKYDQIVQDCQEG